MVTTYIDCSEFLHLFNFCVPQRQTESTNIFYTQMHITNFAKNVLVKRTRILTNAI